MPTIADVVAANLTTVRRRLEQAARAAGRDPATVRFVAVSKTFPADAVRAAAAAGQLDFGENKVQEGLQKIAGNGRSAAQLASHRPPAIEQGAKAADGFAPDPLD